jgi:hypothetical protein
MVSTRKRWAEESITSARADTNERKKMIAAAFMAG